jgi:hypothetical protein
MLGLMVQWGLIGCGFEVGFLLMNVEVFGILEIFEFFILFSSFKAKNLFFI